MRCMLTGGYDGCKDNICCFDCLEWQEGRCTGCDDIDSVEFAEDCEYHMTEEEYGKTKLY